MFQPHDCYTVWTTHLYCEDRYIFVRDFKKIRSKLECSLWEDEKKLKKQLRLTKTIENAQELEAFFERKKITLLELDKKLEITTRELENYYEDYVEQWKKINTQRQKILVENS